MRKINAKCIKLIEKYQASHNERTPSRCLHYPTCSAYAKECYQKFGFFKASFLTTKRILSCNPLAVKTFDPVPLNKEEKERLKEANKKAIMLKDALLAVAKLPDATLETYLSLITQATFGPYVLDQDLLLKLAGSRIENSLNTEKRFMISDEYMLILIGVDTDLEALKYIYDNTEILNEENDKSFLEYSARLNYLYKLVKKRKIKLDKKETKLCIYQALCDYDFKKLSHIDYPYPDLYFLVIKK